MYQLILVEKLKKRREWGDLFCYFHVLFSPYSPACLFHSLFFSNENTNVFTVKKNELWYSYFPSSPSSLTRIREMMLQKKGNEKKNAVNGRLKNYLRWRRSTWCLLLKFMRQSSSFLVSCHFANFINFEIASRKSSFPPRF